MTNQVMDRHGADEEHSSGVSLHTAAALGGFMQSDEQAIRQLVATWVDATKAGDDQKVLSLMSDDLVFLTPGQPPFGKSDFAAGLSGLKDFNLDMSYEIQEIDVFGERAYCWNKISVAMTPRSGGNPVTRAGHALSILKKQDGSWVIARDANMLTAVSQ
jgi:uncharacterized protein (TIGR02246 family)